MKNNNIITTLIVAVVVGAASFYGGLQYERQQSSKDMGKQMMIGEAGHPVQIGAGQAMNGTRKGMMAGNNNFAQGQNRPVMGEIISQDDKSITVKMRDGSTKIVMISDKTEIHKEATGTKAELQKGQTVAAFGIKNSDGSVTANTIQLNPMMRVSGSR